MASKIKVDTLETADGTGSITLNNPLAGNVGIGTSSPTAILDVRRGDASGKIAEFHNNVGYGIEIGSSTADAYISSGYNQDFLFKTGTTATERLKITSDGRGLSQFTAKAWVNFDGNFSGTMTVANGGIRDSHNISTITDHGTGDYEANFVNNCANANYAIMGSATYLLAGTQRLRILSPYSQSAGSARVITGYTDTTMADHQQVTMLIFGD